MSDTERGSRYTGTILEVIRKSNKRDVLQIGINNVVLVRRGLASSRAGLLYVMQSTSTRYPLAVQYWRAQRIVESSKAENTFWKDNCS